MQYKLITLKTIIMIFFLSVNSVLAYIPQIQLETSDSKKAQIEIEGTYEGSQFGHKSDVWSEIQNVLFVSPIHEEYGYLSANETIKYRHFDNMFYYGIEFEISTLIENIKLLSAVEGEYTHLSIEKPIYSKTGIGYEVSDQFVIDCTVEAGVYDAESSKAVLFGTTVTLNIF